MYKLNGNMLNLNFGLGSTLISGEHINPSVKMRFQSSPSKHKTCYGVVSGAYFEHPTTIKSK